MNHNNPSVSVVIRVKNEESFIGHAIQSCIDHLNFPEIIVVDNHSTDESVNIARLFSQDKKLATRSNRFTDLSIISISDYSPGRALNLGIASASNEKIIILSSHAVINTFNLDVLCNELDRYPAVLASKFQFIVEKKSSLRTFGATSLIPRVKICIQSLNKGISFIMLFLS